MAIVPDLNGVPPGRSGNQTGVDSHNMTKLELAFQNDGTRSDHSVSALAIGNNQILAADGTRQTVTVLNPQGNADVAVGIRPLASAVAAGAHPIFNGNGYTWRGKLASQAFYCYSPSIQALTVLVG